MAHRLTVAEPAGVRYICPEDLRQSIRPTVPEISPLHSEADEIERTKAALNTVSGNLNDSVATDTTVVQTNEDNAPAPATQEVAPADTVK